MDLNGMRTWLARPLAIVVAVPLMLAAAYGATWAMTGDAPFTGSEECVEGEASPAGSASPSPSASPSDDEGDARLSLSLSHEPDPLLPGGSVRWRFAVENRSSETVELTFGSGQDGDVTLSTGDREVYRWSEGRAFTQAVRTVRVAPGEPHAFALEDTLGVAAGEYQLRAWVKSSPAPAPVVRTVTVPTDPSPSSTPDADPTPSPNPTDDPSPSPSATPSPSASPSTSPKRAVTLRRRAARARPRRAGRRHALALALLLTVFVAPTLARAQSTDEGSGGKNVVIVLNQTDGRAAGRAGVAVGRANGPAAVPENLASARSICSDCRSVAIAMQAVLVMSSPDVASPRNAAVAVNAGCQRCKTMAYAWQYVVSTGGEVRLTTEGQSTIQSIRDRARALADNSDLPLSAVKAAADQLAAEFRTVIDEEVRAVGGRGQAARAVDVAPTC